MSASTAVTPSRRAQFRRASEFPEPCATTNGRVTRTGACVRSTTSECTCRDPGRDGEPDEHDREADDDVDDVVVRGRHNGERHQNRHDHREDPHSNPPRRLEEDDPDQEVPAGVEARERRILVRKRGRLKRAIAVRLGGHGIDERRVDVPRRRDRKRREEGEADRGRDQHRVAKDVVMVTPMRVQEDRGQRDHGPVPVDVDPVHERNKRRVTDDQPL